MLADVCLAKSIWVAGKHSEQLALIFQSGTGARKFQQNLSSIDVKLICVYIGWCFPLPCLLECQHGKLLSTRAETVFVKRVFQMKIILGINIFRSFLHSFEFISVRSFLWKEIKEMKMEKYWTFLSNEKTFSWANNKTSKSSYRLQRSENKNLIICGKRGAVSCRDESSLLPAWCFLEIDSLSDSRIF